MNRLQHRASPALPRGFSHQDLARRLYVAPAAMVSGALAESAVAAGNGWPVAGGPQVFTAAAVLLRDGGHVTETLAPFVELLDWAAEEGVSEHVSAVVHTIGRKRPAFAGLDMTRPLVMGVLNVTPDSFSDGGDAFATDDAIARGHALLAAGAGIIDVGGESTRPGAEPVSPDAEMRRVLPVIRALAQLGAAVSVDSRHAATMAAAVEAGAAIVNDITALTGDPQALATVARSGAAVVLMHMQGEPRSMQASPQYDFAPLDIFDALADRLAACRTAGIDDARLCVDPGIGFGKTVEHNLQLLARLGLFHGLGVPVLLGASRKSFIARVAGDVPPKQRLGGSLAAVLAAAEQGVQIVRVHDVAETRQALEVWRGVRGQG